MIIIDEKQRKNTLFLGVSHRKKLIKIENWNSIYIFIYLFTDNINYKYYALLSQNINSKLWFTSVGGEKEKVCHL